MANPLAQLSSAAGGEAAQAAAADQGQAAHGTASAAGAPGAVIGAGVGSGSAGVGLGLADEGSGLADVADAGPVLAGDDDANGAPDVGSNLMALLSQLAPAGQ